MTPEIVEIDISKIDSEIAELQRQLNFKVELKNYVRSLSASKQIDDVLEHRKIHWPNPSPDTQQGISSFIITYLRTFPNSESKSIIAAYAKTVGKEAELVRNNVSNALSRLKGDKVDAKEAEGIRGLLWYAK